MPTKKPTKTEKIVEKNMREVFESPPSTLGKNQTAEERRKQQVAIGLEKSRKEGAKLPRKKASKTSY